MILASSGGIFLLNHRQFYLVLVSITIIIMGGVILLDRTPLSRFERHPEDILWMESIRTTALEALRPVRERVCISGFNYPSIRIEGVLPDSIVYANVSERERQLGLDILRSAEDSVVESSEWQDINIRVTPPTPRQYQSLFTAKDHLWMLSIDYIEVLEDIYSNKRQVEIDELTGLEHQINESERTFEFELARCGFNRND